MPFSKEISSPVSVQTVGQDLTDIGTRARPVPAVPPQLQLLPRVRDPCSREIRLFAVHTSTDTDFAEPRMTRYRASATVYLGENERDSVEQMPATVNKHNLCRYCQIPLAPLPLLQCSPQLRFLVSSKKRLHTSSTYIPISDRREKSKQDLASESSSHLSNSPNNEAYFISRQEIWCLIFLVSKPVASGFVSYNRLVFVYCYVLYFLLDDLNVVS
ncbi:hypothetical protein J6590_015897 [Homalodisca vitripennis]|nr:hypothetical protein J6590_015897 [Homalodisca vitripennis]